MKGAALKAWDAAKGTKAAARASKKAAEKQTSLFRR
jgi:hypothetical protein